MPLDALPLQVTHNETACRFETTVDGLRCVVDYRCGAGVVDIHHTGVPRMLEGRGIAAALVKTALAWAQAQGLKVRPSCSYVRAYMLRHPQTLALMA
jgi:predicted GNAT family acetyltransferase